MNRRTISGLDWMHRVRDSKDLVVAAKAVQYRRDKFGEDVKYVSPQTVKHIALAIGTFMDWNGVARVGYQTLQQRFKVTPPTARAALLVIVKAGWLDVEPGGGARRTNIYRARVPAQAEFYKTGCRETPSPPETSYPESKTGRSVTPKKVEEEPSFEEEEGTYTQLVGEGTPA